MNLQQSIIKARKLISQGETEQAIDLLLDFDWSESESLNFVHIISSRLSSLNNRAKDGTITKENLDVDKTKLNKDLLVWLRSVEEKGAINTTNEEFYAEKFSILPLLQVEERETNKIYPIFEEPETPLNQTKLSLAFGGRILHSISNKRITIITGRVGSGKSIVASEIYTFLKLQGILTEKHHVSSEGGKGAYAKNLLQSIQKVNGKKQKSCVIIDDFHLLVDSDYEASELENSFEKLFKQYRDIVSKKSHLQLVVTFPVYLLPTSFLEKNSSYSYHVFKIEDLLFSDKKRFFSGDESKSKHIKDLLSTKESSFTPENHDSIVQLFSLCQSIEDLIFLDNIHEEDHENSTSKFFSIFSEWKLGKTFVSEEVLEDFLTRCAFTQAKSSYEYIRKTKLIISSQEQSILFSTFFNQYLELNPIADYICIDLIFSRLRKLVEESEEVYRSLAPLTSKIPLNDNLKRWAPILIDQLKEYDREVYSLCSKKMRRVFEEEVLSNQEFIRAPLSGFPQDELQQLAYQLDWIFLYYESFCEKGRYRKKASGELESRILYSINKIRSNPFFGNREFNLSGYTLDELILDSFFESYQFQKVDIEAIYLIANQNISAISFANTAKKIIFEINTTKAINKATNITKFPLNPLAKINEIIFTDCHSIDLAIHQVNLDRVDIILPKFPSGAEDESVIVDFSDIELNFRIVNPSNSNLIASIHATNTQFSDETILKNLTFSELFLTNSPIDPNYFKECDFTNTKIDSANGQINVKTDQFFNLLEENGCKGIGALRNRFEITSHSKPTRGSSGKEEIVLYFLVPSKTLA